MTFQFESLNNADDLAYLNISFNDGIDDERKIILPNVSVNLNVSFDLNGSEDIFNGLQLDESLEKKNSSTKGYFAVEKQTKRILNHFLCYNASYNSLQSMARVNNLMPHASIQVPATKYKLKRIIDPKIESEFLIKCALCKNFTPSSKNEVQCIVCSRTTKTSNSEYFVNIPIEQQLRKSIECHLDEIISYHAEIANTNDLIDIHSGKIYENAQKRYPKSIILSLIINTDGAKVFKSNTKSLWLIQLYQGFLPPAIRYFPSNVLISAAHFGPKKPDMIDFFHPFLKEIRRLTDNGGITIMKNGETYNFMPTVLCACCDLPAKSSVQGMIGHTGHYGCSYCLHPGLMVRSPQSNKSFVRYIIGCNNYKTRSHADVIETYRHLKSQSIDGIKYVSCMVAAKGFDLIYGFSIDYMHCVLQGVMKKLLNLWLDTKNHNKPYYIKKQHQIILSTRLVNLKPVSEITRKPKSIFVRGEYKANEMRSLLLFYLRFALPGLLSMKFIEHFQLLSSSIYILLKKKITSEELHDASTKLTKFVFDFENLYGQSNVTMNVHLISHLPVIVENLGPLWAHSAFAFETNNGIVVKSNTCTRDILHQLAFKYTMKHSINTPENKVENISLGNKQTIRAEQYVDTFEEAGLLISNNVLEIYRSICIKGVKFTSLKSKVISTIDYFIQTQDGIIGAVSFYFVIDLTLYAFINTYRLISINDQFIQISKSENNEKKIIDVCDIKGKLLYLKFGPKEYVTSFPNTFEKT